jgi:hypothetical protein
MLHSIEMGWFIIDKYYNRTDEAPVYAAALLLDPSKRIAYMKQNWIEAWIEPSIAGATTIWERDYKTVLPEALVAIPNSMPPPPIASIRPRNELDRLLSEIAVKTAISDDADDFVAFITAPPIKISCTPLEWWCRSDQRSRYPRLHQMAIAVLSIPAESSEPERTFSGARRTCTWDRLSITCEKIEVIESIGNWLKQGLIKPVSANGMGLPVSPPPGNDIDSIDDEMVASIEWY